MQLNKCDLSAILHQKPNKFSLTEVSKSLSFKKKSCLKKVGFDCGLSCCFYILHFYYFMGAIIHINYITCKTYIITRQCGMMNTKSKIKDS